MESADVSRLEKVTRELSRYEHPLFEWKAIEIGENVEVTVSVKSAVADVHEYRFLLKPREVDARAFEWDFQRLLYNYLHDYLVEMFTRSPHIADLS